MQLFSHDSRSRELTYGEGSMLEKHYGININSPFCVRRSNFSNCPRLFEEQKLERLEKLRNNFRTHQRTALHKKSRSLSSLCNLSVLCVSVVDEFRVKPHHRNTEVAQRNPRTRTFCAKPCRGMTL